VKKLVILGLFGILLWFTQLIVVQNTNVGIYLGIGSMLLIPYTVGTNKINLNQYKLDLVLIGIAKWVIGLTILYISWLVMFWLPLSFFYKILIALCINFVYVLFNQKEEESVSIYTNRQKIQLIVGSLFACIITYTLFNLVWGGDTQMTDVYNHNTVVNSILQGYTGFLPTQLTDSIQLNTYSTVFHFLFTLGRSFFPAYELYTFQQIIQWLLISITYITVVSLSFRLSKNWYLSLITPLLLFTASSPTPTFVHYSFVPNTIYFIVLPLFFSLFLQSKNKVLHWITIVFLALLHAFNSVFILILYIVKIIIRGRFKNIFVILSLSTLISLLVGQIIFKLNIPYYLSFVPYIKSLVTSTSDPAVLGSLISYFHFSGVWYFIIATTSGIYFLLQKKVTNNLFILAFLLLSLTLLSLLVIPFSDRFAAILPAIAIPLFVVIIDKLDTNKNYKHLIAIFIIVFSIIQMANLSYKPIDTYYSSQFWTRVTDNELKNVTQLLTVEQLESLYIMAEPMTQMVLLSNTGVRGSGTYMLPLERKELYTAFINGQPVCKKNYTLIAINSRLISWLEQPSKQTSNTENIWYDNVSKITNSYSINQTFLKISNKKTKAISLNNTQNKYLLYDCR
jgi:hypothetical protein